MRDSFAASADMRTLTLFFPAGYYLTFISSALWNEAARVMRRHIRPYVIPDTKAEKSVKAYVYHVASTILTISSLNYLGTPFQVGDHFFEPLEKVVHSGDHIRERSRYAVQTGNHII